MKHTEINQEYEQRKELIEVFGDFFSDRQDFELTKIEYNEEEHKDDSYLEVTISHIFKKYSSCLFLKFHSENGLEMAVDDDNEIWEPLTKNLILQEIVYDFMETLPVRSN